MFACSENLNLGSPHAGLRNSCTRSLLLLWVIGLVITHFATTNRGQLLVNAVQQVSREEAVALIRLRSGLVSESFAREVQTPIDQKLPMNLDAEKLQAQESRFLVKLGETKFGLLKYGHQ